MNPAELQRYLDGLMTWRQHDDGNLTLGCAYCPVTRQHVYWGDLYRQDFEDVAERLIAHLRERHPEKLPFEPVTDEEVAEVFGTPSPRRRSTQ